MTPHESTIKKENKSNSKLKIRNFLFAIVFMLIIFVGFLGTAIKTHATDTPPVDPVGICSDPNNEILQYALTYTECTKQHPGFKWTVKNGNDTATTTTTPTDKNTPLEKNLDSCLTLAFGDVGGCLGKISYLLFYQVPAYLLVQSGNFFNAVVALTLGSGLYAKSQFIPTAWAIVRDLSNIFFILILLFVAIQTILGQGGHDTKKTIGKVIIVALLINFSMFFTQVVVDSSNVLALVFYNKLGVQTKINNEDAPYVPVTNTQGERDISGSMVNAFKPDKFMSESFFDSLKKRSAVVPPKANIVVTGLIAVINPYWGAAVAGYQILGYFFPQEKIPVSTLIAIILLCGLVMGFAAYCFVVAGFSFLGRLIELWVLIIFSPFAFMSFSVPFMEKIEYIGWDDWLQRLLKVSFMAPIFMFFMYFIFLLIRTNIFSGLARTSDEAQQRPIETIIFILIPTFVILILLLKATEYAKKGSGKFGEAVMSGAKLAAGLAVGGVALGTAAIARGGVGSFMKGASTGDTAANRMQGSNARIATHEATLARAGTTVVERAQARKEIWRERKDQIKGTIQQRLGIQGAQTWVGRRLNQDQHNVEHAAHARHDLDSAASDTTHGRKKKWDDLNGEERYETRRQMARDRVIRDNAPATTAGALVDPVTGQAYGAFGSRGWDKLSTQERNAVDRSAGVGNDPLTNHAIHGGALETNTTVADTVIQEARMKQGLVSSVVQSSVTGSYDVRNLANLVAREQTTGIAKMAMGLTGAIALGMRGGFKQMGVNYGTAEGKFFKDLGSTITESLKNIKINVDLSHVGEVKKEGDKGGHDGGHH